MEVVWGVPTGTIKRRVEKYDTPVVTMAAILKDGAGRKISFNKAAVEALGLVKPTEEEATFVAVGFIEDDLFVKAFTTEGDNMFKTNKSFSFSDKRTFEYIIKKKSLEIGVENHLHLEEVEGQGMFKVTNITHSEAEVKTPDAALPEATKSSTTAKSTAKTAEIIVEESADADVATADEKGDGPGAIFSAQGEDFEDESKAVTEEDGDGVTEEAPAAAIAPVADATPETDEDGW